MKTSETYTSPPRVTSSHTIDNASPLPVRERIQALDVLRGVAVAGILLANVMVFFGLIFMPPDRVAALPTAA